VWDVDSAFGELHGEAATYLTAPLALQPTLALRVGGQRVWGRYPFHEAAFLGGPDTLRGLRSQRYAGDGLLWGNSELRVRLGAAELVVPAEFGVFALADAGRVFLDGEASSRWHTGVGGGIWLAFAKRANLVSLSVARSEGKTRFYAQTGFMF
jgi:hemolysin activation/secretion protein